MKKEPITHAQYLALPEEERELYGPKEDQAWEFDWVPAVLTIEHYKSVGIETRSVHYLKPVEAQHSEAEGVQQAMKVGYKERQLNAPSSIANYCNGFRDASQWQAQQDAAQITTLQTALAEKDNEIKKANTNAGLLEIQYRQKERLLNSCESALECRDINIKELQAQLAEAQKEIERLKEAQRWAPNDLPFDEKYLHNMEACPSANDIEYMGEHSYNDMVSAYNKGESLVVIKNLYVSYDSDGDEYSSHSWPYEIVFLDHKEDVECFYEDEGIYISYNGGHITFPKLSELTIGKFIQGMRLIGVPFELTDYGKFVFDQQGTGNPSPNPHNETSTID